jgi:hypothetical protein
MEPLRTHFPRLEEKELNRFVNLLKQGNNPISCNICKTSEKCPECPHKQKPIRDIVIESHIPLVMYVAKILGGNKRVEAAGVGLLALTQAIDDMPHDIVNIGGWVRKWVTEKIKTFLISDTTIRVPHYGLPTYSHLRVTFALDGNTSVMGEQGLVDLREILVRIPQTENCIEEGGYSVQDMAEMCSLGRSSVSQIKHRLLDRIQTALRKELV